MTRPSSNRLPEKYYVRRRAAAVIVLLVVVGLLIWAMVAWGSSGSGDEADTAAGESTTSAAAESPSPTSTQEQETAETTSMDDQDTKSPPSSDAEEPEESPYPDAPEGSEESSEVTADPERTTCELSDLEITAASDQPSYPADTQPTFYMTVANPTGVDCEINLDEATLRFEVYSLATNERIWSDTDCNASVEDGLQTFASGEERYFSAVWSRTASAPGACDNRPVVPAGAYFLHAVVGDNPSPAYTFNLG